MFCHYECHYSGCQILFYVMLSVIMLSVIMLSAVVISVIMLCIIMIGVEVPCPRPSTVKQFAEKVSKITLHFVAPEIPA
jgi:hypothetical protein